MGCKFEIAILKKSFALLFRMNLFAIGYFCVSIAFRPVVFLQKKITVNSKN